MPSVGLYEWVTRPFPQTFTHIVAGDFVNPQFTSQGAWDLFCYDRAAGIGRFYATVKNGKLDNGVNVIDGPLEFGPIHTFDQRWSLIGHIGARQLLFYDASSRVAEVHRVETDGGLTLQQRHVGMVTTWSHMVPGQFGSSQVLLYDKGTGYGEFHHIDPAGNMSLVASHHWATGWDLIVRGNFSNSANDDLLFYRQSGAGEFYRVNDNGGTSLLADHENWLTTWTQIVPGQYVETETYDGLLFYDGGSTTGIATTDGHGSLQDLATLFGAPWASPWQTVIAGTFIGNIAPVATSDLVAYSKEFGLIRYFHVVPAAIATVTDLRGIWTDGGSAFPVISESGTDLSIDMSSQHRPTAHGSVIDSQTITVTFADDATFTGTLHAPGTIVWSNSSSWTKVTVIDLRGIWTDGGSAFPVISESGTDLSIDMSSQHRPTAHGSVIDSQTITVTFADDATFTGTLHAPGTIVWSNSSSWTKTAPQDGSFDHTPSAGRVAATPRSH